MSSRVVLITGANSGVGYAASKVIASASDAFHVIMAGRSLDKVQTALSEIKSSNGIRGTLSPLQLDVTDEDSVRTAAKEVEQKHGHLDVLINNAAIGSRDPDVRVRMSLCMATNVVGPAMVSEIFRPLLLKSASPYSIYVSSGGGSMTRASAMKHLDYEDAYRASKAALNMIAVVENRDFKDQGLKTFAMCPGFVVSNLRGTDEESRTGWGNAGDPLVAGQTLLSMINGERDNETGLLIHKDGVYPW